jgi:hypothetical protein
MGAIAYLTEQSAWMQMDLRKLGLLIGLGSNIGQASTDFVILQIRRRDGRMGQTKVIGAGAWRG